MGHRVIRIDQNRAADGVVRFAVDTPIADSVDPGDLLSMTGWAYGLNARIARVEIHWRGHEVGSATADHFRPDVARTFPDDDVPERCGFTALVAMLGLPEDVKLDVVAYFESGAHQLLASVHARRTRWVHPAEDTDPNPLLLTTLGRTGSTWFMHMLSAIDEVAVYPEWPYEFPATRYWMRHLHEITGHPQGPHAPPLFTAQSDGDWFNGASPWARQRLREWFSSDYTESVGGWVRSSIQGFYRAVSDDVGKPQPRFFAEKMLPGLHLEQLIELFPVHREIVLVRDFRSMVASILAFNRKRGPEAPDFGRGAFGSDAEYVRVALGHAVGSLMRVCVDRPEALVVRYEDAVADPRTVIRNVLAHLGASPDADAVDRVLRRWDQPHPAMEGHRTTQTGSESLDRWQAELPPDVREACDMAFADALAFFGYVT